MCSDSRKQMSESFLVISNLAVTTRIAVDYFRYDFFLKRIFQFEQVTKPASGSENNIKGTLMQI